MRKYEATQNKLRKHRMEAEHTNAIGNRLTDLAARTAELRGYL